MASSGNFEKELGALGIVLNALEPLDENQRTFIIKAVVDRLDLEMGIAGILAKPAGLGGAIDSLGENLKEATPKEFLKQKKPSTDVQKVTCLAYYLAHVRNKPKFKTQDISKLNTEAAGRKFSNASKSVNNATLRNGFLASAGKGTKQITVLGEDVVEALPDQSAVKAIIAENPVQKRKAKKKAATKK